ncbi:MAG: MFS transporter, partial [Luminiphilus sp.]
AQVTTGRRSEGVFFAALTFVRKTNQGIGIFIAGLMLQWVDFPEGAVPDDVGESVLWNLGATLIPSQCLLWALMLWALVYYRIDRQQHQANLVQLAGKQ